MRLLLIIFLSGLYSTINSQDYFVKRFDASEESTTGKQIFQYGNRYYATFGHFCGNVECSTLVELNESGDTLWTKTNADLDLGFEATIISNDTITFASNNDPINTHFRMAHFDLDGNKISETMEVKHPTLHFTSSFQLTFQKVKDKFFIMGSAERNEDNHSLLYSVDSNGRLDTLLIMAKAGRRSTVWDSDLDHEGNLVTFHKMEEPFNTKDWIRIIKYNSNLDSIWGFDSEESFEHHNSTRGAVIGDEIVYKIYTPNANRGKESLRIVTSDLEERTIYEPETLSSLQREFVQLKILKDGDILGFGIFQDVTIEPKVNSAPWLIRMSPEGDIRWQRVFYELDPSDNEARFGVVRDVIELPNGDLYGIGEIRYEIPTTFIFKVNADGCLNPDDCGLLNFITNTLQPEIETSLRVYPSPAAAHISIALDQDNTDVLYTIINTLGQSCSEVLPLNKDELVDISDLGSGHYYILLIKDGNIIGKQSFIKG